MKQSNDKVRPSSDRPWLAAGAGLSITMRCWFCNQPRSTAGSRRVGPLKLLKCAACVGRTA